MLLIRYFVYNTLTVRKGILTIFANNHSPPKPAHMMH